MTILFVVIGAVFVLGGAVMMVREIRNTSKKLKAVIHEPSTNDDDRAVVNFTDLLEKAHSNMVVYDDGDNTERSIYMQEGVVEAVKKKLDDVPEFTMYCYFNNQEARDTLFCKAFDGHYDRVDIQTRPNGEIRPDDTHYKIIDGGRMAYLSRHEHGSSKREFQVIDCTRVSDSDLKEMTDSLLGEYKQDIERKFPSQPAS